jgi:hypothetical protein
MAKSKDFYGAINFFLRIYALEYLILGTLKSKTTAPQPSVLRTVSFPLVRILSQATITEGKNDELALTSQPAGFDPSG